MAIKVIFGHDPFVRWRFNCKTRAEVRSNTKIANEKLNFYLAGYNAAIISLKKKRIVFTVKDKKLKPLKPGSTIFLFEPRVFRRPKNDGTDLTTNKVPRPQQPNP